MRTPCLSCLVTLSSLLLSPALVCTAQTPAPAPKPAAKTVTASVQKKDRYAGEPFIIERSDWVYSENADGTGYREHTVAIKLQSDAAARNFQVVAVPFASASEHVDFHYARVRHADGSVTETPGSAAIEQPEPVTRQSPFYSDLKEEQLPIRNLQSGDTLEWQARITTTRAEAPNQFWGSESFLAADAVTREESIELHVPVSSYVNVWTNPELHAAPTVSTDGGQKIYRWTSSQLQPTTGPEAEAAKKARKEKPLTGDELLDNEEGKLPSVAWTTFHTWADVGAWYRGLEAQRAQPDDEIKAKVAELTANSKTEEDKVRAVYAYVSSQIHYIGVAFGVGRVQPHAASTVLENQYGDCKDKATLLAAMLTALGLHPDTVLIGAQVRFNEAVPSPSSFNHAINRVELNGQQVWLDSTQEVAPYRALLSVLRDKPALAVPDHGPAVLVHTPKDLLSPEVDTWKAVGTLNDQGISDSHIAMTFTGDTGLFMRSVIHQIAPAQYDEAAQKLFAALGYGGTASRASFTRPDDTSIPFAFDVDYHREKAGDWADLKTIPQLPPVQMPNVDENDPPVAPINLGVLHQDIATAEMKLPAGWTVQLPEAVHQNTPWVTYDETYRFSNNTLYTERKITILQQKVPVADWKAYKKWTEAINLGYENYVQLIRPGADGKPLPAGTAGTHTSNPEAEDLIRQAVQSTQKMDDTTAEVLLKRAKAIDPQARGLWNAYGYLAIMRGKPNEAIDDYRKELAAYPEELTTYQAIAGAQAMHHDQEGAIATLHQWIAADPANSQPQAMLAQLLLADKKPADAIPAAEQAIALLPEDKKEQNEGLHLLLGEAQLRGGAPDKGEATLVALLNSTENPGLLNDASYELAEQKRQLPLDEQKSALALSKMATESQSWTLDEAPNTLKAKTNLIVAAWDTYGWILYLEGKPAQAQPWIQAAWMNMHHSEVKGHLAEIDKTLNKPFIAPKNDQADRTLELGSYSGSKAVAEYRVLLAHGKVERLEPAGPEQLKDVEPMLQKADFSRLFPPASDAHIVRTGMLNCVSGKCQFVLEP